MKKWYIWFRIELDNIYSIKYPSKMFSNNMKIMIYIKKEERVCVLVDYKEEDIRI